jgi:nickel-type superoxide dismutase maturation protease
MRRVRGLIGPLLACVALAVLARRWLDVVEVRGRSMMPTLFPGDRLLALRRWRSPRLGQVVIAPDPRDPSRELVKRVASIDAAGVTLRGDNPAFSTDGRAFGPVPADQVGWSIVARIWPMRRAALVRRRTPPADLDEGGEPACAVPESLVGGSG